MFLFKCQSCSHREMGVIPFNLTLDSQMNRFNEFEEEFMKNTSVPNVDGLNHKTRDNKVTINYAFEKEYFSPHFPHLS